MRFWDILNRTGNRQRRTEDGGRRTEDGGRWARGKSSFWSGLFVAEMPPGPLSSSGAAWHRADDPTHHWRAVGCKMPFGAAPKGAWPSLQGGRYYKHGAPNGAEPISVVEDTHKVPVSVAPSPLGSTAVELGMFPRETRRLPPHLPPREERVGVRRAVLTPPIPLTPTLSPSDGEREKGSHLKL